MSLPDFDKIPGIISQPGVYSLDRWPLNVSEQIRFLQEVLAKWGPDASMTIVDPHDGYPGYIRVAFAPNDRGYAAYCGTGVEKATCKISWDVGVE